MTIQPARDVELLLSENAEAISALSAKLGPELHQASSIPLDDLFLLRFLLSHPGVDEAEEAVRNTLEWRRSKTVYLEVETGVGDLGWALGWLGGPRAPGTCPCRHECQDARANGFLPGQNSDGLGCWGCNSRTVSALSALGPRVRVSIGPAPPTCARMPAMPPHHTHAQPSLPHLQRRRQSLGGGNVQMPSTPPPHHTQACLPASGNHARPFHPVQFLKCNALIPTRAFWQAAAKGTIPPHHETIVRCAGAKGKGG
jgi:hypothetical protein